MRRGDALMSATVKVRTGRPPLADDMTPGLLVGGLDYPYPSYMCT